MKKVYETPDLTIERFIFSEIITASEPSSGSIGGGDINDELDDPFKT